MKKIALVTGGAGFIGSELTRQLLEAGVSVTVLDNLSFGIRKNIWKGIRFVRGDVRKDHDVGQALNRTYDFVFHLAALHFIPYCNAHPLETLAVNVMGTATLLSALKKRPCKKFFFASSAAVYDSSSRYHNENEACLPLDVYGISKLLGEDLVQDFQKSTHIPCVVGRLFNAYGPRETNPHLIPHIVAQLKSHAPTIHVGNLSPYRDYVSTQDLGQLIAKATTRAKKGVTTLNMGSGHEYSVRQVLSCISEILGRKLTIESMPALQRKTERKHLRADLSRLKKFLGEHRYVPFTSGLENLLQSEGVILR